MSDANTQNTQNAGNAGPVAAAPAQGKQLPEACEHTTRHSITVNLSLIHISEPTRH